MTVLVTGGAGYVGAHVVEHLVQMGRPCVVLDSLELGASAAVPGETRLVVGSIADDRLVRSICEHEGVTAIIHCAAYKSVGESMQFPERYFLNNAAGGNSLINSALKSGVKNLVFSSSCSVYGTPEKVPVTEDSCVRPESPYGESKLMTERMLEWYGRCRGLRSVSLRYFNAAGASPDGHIGEDWRMCGSLVPVIIESVLGRRPPVRVFGNDYPTKDGTAIRDYIHVVDLAAAHIQALAYLERGGQTTVVNLGTGRGSSVMEVIDEAAVVVGRPVPYEVAARRAGDPACVYADISRALELLAWTPEHTLGDMIASAYGWHSSRVSPYPE